MRRRRRLYERPASTTLALRMHASTLGLPHVVFEDSVVHYLFSTDKLCTLIHCLDKLEWVGVSNPPQSSL